MKKIFLIGCLCAGLALASCGGSSDPRASQSGADDTTASGTGHGDDKDMSTATSDSVALPDTSKNVPGENQ
ncbi:hypothetical protein EOD41_16450 [Mucilaginibacter limnophilus]|uniref:Entericidin n=1 Tax=Mucilaginibacter limnophilus TaxID=1932778 RepID=A0A3S2VKW1_9SPHI|nr:hypothetical protein [Mucilaginibacter limnophilus]RVT98383.1 hypothetical protein EOD41_16450 [Mucilaginibacter limnophilus]